jgi:hypothetical protein
MAVGKERIMHGSFKVGGDLMNATVLMQYFTGYNLRFPATNKFAVSGIRLHLLCSE